MHSRFTCTAVAQETTKCFQKCTCSIRVKIGKGSFFRSWLAAQFPESTGLRYSVPRNTLVSPVTDPGLGQGNPLNCKVPMLCGVESKLESWNWTRNLGKPKVGSLNLGSPDSICSPQHLTNVKQRGATPVQPHFTKGSLSLFSREMSLLRLVTTSPLHH